MKTMVKIVPQVEEQFEMVSNKVFMIPWGHIKLLIDKCHDNPQKFSFYVDKVIENNWSKDKLILLDIIDRFQRKLLTEDENFYYTLYMIRIL